MTALIVAVSLLMIAASLGSWLISQWIGARQRTASTMVAVGGAGIALLIAAAAITIIAAPTWWQSLLPKVEFTGGDVPAGASVGELVALDRREGPSELSPSDKAPSDTTLAPLKSRKQLDPSLRAARDQNLPQSADASAPQSVIAEHRVASPPEVPPFEASYISGVAGFDPLFKDWPATECVMSSRSADRGRWSLDNECPHVVAIVFAWCRQATAACAANTASSSGWRYEPAGILMTTLEQRPSPYRLTKDGPLIAPIYVLAAVGDVPRVRYLACEVTSTELLALLNEPPAFGTDADREAAFDVALHLDKCYTRVAQLSRAGRRTGKSPDALLLQGAEQ